MKLELIVGPNGNNSKKWKITNVKNGEILKTCNTQKEAITKARNLSKTNTDGGEVSIQGKNGKIRDKNSYKKDPRITKG